MHSTVTDSRSITHCVKSHLETGNVALDPSGNAASPTYRYKLYVKIFRDKFDDLTELSRSDFHQIFTVDTSNVIENGTTFEI